MFVPGGGPPAGAFGGGPQHGGYGGGPQHGGYGGGPQHGGPAQPRPHTPSAPAPLMAPPMAAPLAAPAPIPAAPVPQYLASQTASRAGRPIEPWKDSLRLMMFIWGGILLAAFVTPRSTDPLAFNWNAIIEAPGTAKLPPLLLVAVGVLSISLATIPLQPAARGLLAAVLGLAGFVTPFVLLVIDQGLDDWQSLVQVAGLILLIPALFVRHEYRDAMLPRILVTAGALAVLAPELIPQHGDLPLVAKFQKLIDAPGEMKIIAALDIVSIVLVVLTLLAWLPSPSSGMAKLLGWLLILWPLIEHLANLIVPGPEFIDAIVATPFAALMVWAAFSPYLVLIGYGLASVIGKQLE
jgi:hypothetical protein